MKMSNIMVNGNGYSLKILWKGEKSGKKGKREIIKERKREKKK